MEYFKLRNGIEIPAIGLGTWQITDRTLMKTIIQKAYETGFRLIDTASAYTNEIAISKAVKENEIPRNELILSDKVWNTSRGFEAVITACKKSLKKLKTEYFDIYLIHWPASKKLYPNWEEINADTWRGMEELYRQGLAKSIGVCNFKEHHLEALKKTAEIMPFINQIEFHPGMNQESLLNYCKTNSIQIEASSPLGNGQVLKNQELQKIASLKSRTTAQLCLRWLFQKGIVSIPKTSNPDRLQQNISIFDFELNETEMKTIDNIPYCGGIGIDPDEVTQFG